MSTWHQDRAAHPLWHASQWSVVTDPPGRSRSVMRYDTAEQADQYVANVKKLSADNPADFERQLAAKHTYIIPPTGTQQ